MAHVKLRVSEDNFHDFKGKRIQQGEVCAGRETLGTILRSCVCIGLYCPDKRVGAISHVTGFSEDEGHSPKGALDLMLRGLRAYDVVPGECECFLVGGANSSRHVYQAAVDELSARGLRFEDLDTLGRFHRKLMFNPATGVVTLYKKADPPESQRMTKSDRSYKVFNDPRKRLVTGATLLFRNRHLLDLIRAAVLPEVLARSNRFHVWCAGCSIGMEAYSVAMVILDELARRGGRTDFRVLGSDISIEALDTAMKGVYPLSGQNYEENKRLIDRYARKLDDRRVRMGDELRRTVVFRQRDIRQGSRRHRFEFVVCDHVFQYFDEEVQREFLDSLVRALQPGGFLYLSTPSHVIQDMATEQHKLLRTARNLYRVP